MNDLPRPDLDTHDDADPPGGPWKSWRSIYVTLAVWGVVCILFLIWVTSTLNIEVGGGDADSGDMDAHVAAEVAL